MKKTYELPKVDVIKFANEDIITTSPADVVCSRGQSQEQYEWACSSFIEIPYEA